MPYIHITTSTSIDETKKSALLEQIAPLIPILPGKNRGNAMVQLDDSRFMAMGDPAQICAFCEIRLYKQSPAEAKEKFAAALTKLLGKELGVAPDHVYLNYMEMDHWGLSGILI